MCERRIVFLKVTDTVGRCLLSSLCRKSLDTYGAGFLVSIHHAYIYGYGHAYGINHVPPLPASACFRTEQGGVEPEPRVHQAAGTTVDKQRPVREKARRPGRKKHTNPDSGFRPQVVLEGDGVLLQAPPFIVLTLGALRCSSFMSTTEKTNLSSPEHRAPR